MLNELVLNEFQEIQREHQNFKVDNLESANWVFRKLRAIEEQRAEYKALAEKEIERITAWLQAEEEKLNNQEAFFNGLLTEYAIEQRRLNPKFKLSTPYGKLSFRKQQPKWKYDEETVLLNLKRHAMFDFIRVKEEINKAELKKVADVINGHVVLKDTGEIIEGITVEEQPETIKIEVI
ncbi:host-nuclease inhibitor Gam family protein [Clostridium sp. SYSU_GA19001]|uniref:host-nuclease inhibitor Gam family protein n=1 Tax=Clostridium caldaquaticum TaxID=2940653 RepID=UPI002076ECB6|nr:host-nuclease inhibitor Gam family protein [Clostridium caldaquaticum]MCM8710507.1 host-nuclease inhibitor Gam family protein [Clostridium caldaquaticum]